MGEKCSKTNAARQIEVEGLLLNYVVDTLQPYTSIQNVHFQNLLTGTVLTVL